MRGIWVRLILEINVHKFTNYEQNNLSLSCTEHTHNTRVLIYFNLDKSHESTNQVEAVFVRD
jgi:hypothetical protein